MPKERTSHEDRRSQPRALSPHAQLSRPAAGHSRHVEKPRGVHARLRRRSRQCGDVFLDAGSRRHAYRRAAPFRAERHADQRIPARELHRARHLPGPAPHRAQGRDHAGGPRSRGKEGRRADPEGRHGAALHRPSRAHLPEARLFDRQSGRKRRRDRMARQAGHRAFRYRLDASRSRQPGEPARPQGVPRTRHHAPREPVQS